MAEDDRFAKKLGWGYKKTYKLACRGETGAIVARTLVRAIARQMKAGGLLALRPILLELMRALSNVFSARGELFGSADVSRAEFNSNLGAIAARHGYTQPTRMLCAVAEQVFEQQQASTTASAESITAAFANSLTSKLADYHLLAVAAEESTIRFQLMRENGRDETEQRKFEQDLVSHAVPAVTNLMAQAVKAPNGVPTRTPRLPKAGSAFRLEELHDTLA